MGCRAGIIFAALSLVIIPAGHAQAVRVHAPITITDLSHALEGRTLIITGRVQNAGPDGIVPLAIDAAAFGPAGDLVSTGADGIPWELRPGQAERFTITVPLGRSLIREYVVQVTRPGIPSLLASARRGVDVGLYRQHLPTLIELRGQVLHGLLMVRADGPALPVIRITAEASVLVFDPLIDWFRPTRLRIDLSPEGSATVFLGTTHAILVSLRLVDLDLKASWSD